MAALLVLMPQPSSAQCEDLDNNLASLRVTNRWVWATTVFGVLSVVGSLAVLAVGYGYNKDRRSHRDRILAGMFLANLLFSLGNVIPYQLQNDQPGPECSDYTLSTPAQCVGQGMWMGGKYMMAMFEIFIVTASVVSLQTGSITMPRRFEVPAHVLCVAVGLGVFAYFDVRCFALDAEIEMRWSAAIADFSDAQDAQTAASNRNDAAAYNAAIATYNAAADTYAAEADTYAALVRDLLRWWLTFLGVVLVAWIGQRVYLRRLFVEWVTIMTELTETVEYELWSRGSKEVEEQKARHRIMLAKQKEGYLEVTKPLEPYVAVFVAFSIPAIVMATDWCDNQTESSINHGTAACDSVAPAFLALRTLATVCVYFSDAGCRAELRDHRKLRRKIWLRLRGFGGWCCGAVAGDPDAAGYRVHFSTELEMASEADGGEDRMEGTEDETGAGVPYQAM